MACHQRRGGRHIAIGRRHQRDIGDRQIAICERYEDKLAKRTPPRLIGRSRSVDQVSDLLIAKACAKVIGHVASHDTFAEPRLERLVRTDLLAETALGRLRDHIQVTESARRLARPPGD